MKKFRSSFNHFVREKVITGAAGINPEPESRDLSILFPDLIHSTTGSFEYQLSACDISGSGSVSRYFSQGAMGYGNPPIGSGTLPYAAFMSNKTKHATQDVYTGSPTPPEILFKGLSYTGLGATFAVGTAMQYVITSSDETRNAYLPGREHVLASIHGINTQATYTAVDDFEVASGIIDFCYKNSSDNSKGYSMYLKVRDSNGSESDQNLVNGVHFYTSYGRLMPMSVSLSADGGYEFRCDSSILTGNVTSLINSLSDPLVMPTDGELGLTLRGLQISPFSSPWSGISNPITRLTNVAVNDNDDSDGKGDVNLPPFVVGIPCTPIRESETDWEMPIQVIDPDSAWIPFSDSGETFDYGLSAVADSQLFETRGVAASALDSDLHVYTADTTTLEADLSAKGLQGLSAVESINSIIYDSTVLKDSNDLSLEITQYSPFTPITDAKVFEGIKGDFLDSHLSHFYTATGNDMLLSDFANGLVFTLNLSAAAT